MKKRLASLLLAAVLLCAACSPALAFENPFAGLFGSGSSSDAVIDLTKPFDESPSSVKGVRKGVKDFADSYEAFFDEYIAFMQKTTDNPGDLSLLASYGDMMLRLAEFTEAEERMDDVDLTDAELKYWTQVLLRVEAKMLKTAGTMN